jgi:hypothetical protein
MRFDMPTDWEGRPIPPGRGHDAVIRVWEYEFQPTRHGEPDSYRLESWQRVLSDLAHQIERRLEMLDPDDPGDVLTVRVRLARTTPREMAELDD